MALPFLKKLRQREIMTPQKVPSMTLVYGSVYAKVTLPWLWAVDSIRPAPLDFIGVLNASQGWASFCSVRVSRFRLTRSGAPQPLPSRWESSGRWRPGD